MQERGSLAAPWLYWRSEDSFRNPFTLTLLELFCHTSKAALLHTHCKRPTSVVARQEFVLEADLS